MTVPSYEQLMDFYCGFLAFEQEHEKDERETIELIQALWEGYQNLADDIVQLRNMINDQSAKMLRVGIIKNSTPPFPDLYSDIQVDFTQYKAYQKYADGLKHIT